ncbi:MAG TPA: VC_2705 family sodium/solute symporter, partial [Anaerolineae bacterium]|nr:VC_2705 family sodium/solute symporter [Anaerolineae bacterium]
QAARAIAAVAAVFISFTYVAGQMRGVGIVFSRYLQVEIWLGVVIGMIIVAFFAVLGGMKGITWTQVAQYSVLILAYLIPAFALAFIITGIPVPQMAITFGDIIPRLEGIQTELGLGSYINSSRPMIDVLAITIALMAGTAGLPHVIVRFYTVPSVRAARYSAGWALLFIALLYTTAPALASFAKLNLIDTLNGVSVEAVQNEPSLSWARSWETTGLLSFEDKNGDGVYSLTSGDANEVSIDRDIIVLATPEVAGLSAPIIALTAAGGLAAALSTASGLLLVISSSLSHDLYYRLIKPTATEGERLMVGRLVIFGAILVAGYFGINPPGFVAEVVAFAFGLAAASFFPLILLGIFDKRINSTGAISGMIVGLVFTTVMIVGQRSVQLLGTPEPMIGPFFGITAQGIGTVGMILNFVITYAVSHATEAPPQEVQDMVESVRIPRGAGAASGH